MDRDKVNDGRDGPIALRVLLVLAVVLICVLGGVAGYGWAAVTTSYAVCQAGGGGSVQRTFGFIALTPLGPLLCGWRASRSGVGQWNVVALVFVGICCAGAAVFLGDAFWWSAHDCYT